MLLYAWLIFFVAYATVYTVQSYDRTEESSYKFHNPVTADLNSPWITGPKEKRYQFHLGQQSWLSARENCLAQNADLVTISSTVELNWILDHYKPQFSHVNERQIQVGLLIDHTEAGQTKEWRWVDQTPLNDHILKWTSGEPFDHAFGRERCALLNVNSRLLQDVDCDLHGSSVNQYRFVCERSGEKHDQHEMLNNPMLKKLTDILDFFGVSGGATSASPADSNDYVDSVAKDGIVNSTSAATTTITSTPSKESETQKTTPKEQQTTIQVDTVTTIAANELESSITYLSTATVTNSSETSTDVNTENTSVSTTDAHHEAEIESLSSTKYESTTLQSFHSESTTFDKEIDETSTSATAAAETTEAETASPPKKGKKIKTVKAFGGGKSVNLNSEDSRRLEEFAHDDHNFDLRNHRLIEPEGVYGIPAPIISDNAENHDSAAAAVVATEPVVKSTDPLEKIADSLEHSILVSNDTNNTKNSFTTDKNSGNGKQITKRIHTLERIISAVQKMVEHPENIAPSSDSASVTGNVEAEEAERLVSISSTDNKQNDRLGLKITAIENEDDLAFNIEGDFLQAQKEARKHPNVNSGDFVIRANSDVIGACGGGEPSNNAKIDKHSNVREFVQSLRKYLASDENSELKRILEDNAYGNVTFLEKLEAAARDTAGNSTSSKNQTATSSKDGDDPENPVKSLIRLYDAKFHKEKKEKIDAEISEELKNMAEVEEQKISSESDEDEKEDLPSKVRWSSEDTDESEERSTDDERLNMDITTTADSTIITSTEIMTDMFKTSDSTTPEARYNIKPLNETFPLNPTDQIMDVLTHNPTQELIDAIINVQDQFKALLPSDDIVKHNSSKNENDDSFPIPPSTMDLSAMERMKSDESNLKAQAPKIDDNYQNIQIKQSDLLPPLKAKSDATLPDKAIKSAIQNFVAA